MERSLRSGPPAAAMTLDTRGIVERFFVVDSPQFSRYRHRVRLRSARRLGPCITSLSGSSTRRDISLIFYSLRRKVAATY
jgi:hypothetical protein